MDNPLYDKDVRAIMGRAIKHPSMIKTYTMPNYNCTTDKLLEFIGLDFETDALTGEIVLLEFSIILILATIRMIMIFWMSYADGSR